MSEPTKKGGAPGQGLPASDSFVFDAKGLPVANGNTNGDIAMTLTVPKDDPLRDPPAAPKPAKYALETGRIYHDDHFVSGILQPSSLDGQGGLTQRMSSPFTAAGSAPAEDLNAICDRVGTGYTGYTGTGYTGPIERMSGRPSLAGVAGVMRAPSAMPKWPANWQSAAFEAVSVKKSFVLSPPEIYAECAHHGEEKSKFSWYKLMALSIIAGCYVGFGYTTCLLVGGLMDQAPSNPEKSEVNVGVFRALFGAFGFPFGFTTIVVCGAELYTSICAYSAAAWWEGKINALTTLRMLAMSWIGNFMGTSIMVGLFFAAHSYTHRSEYLVYAAEDKFKYGWGSVLVKGIFANWLVGIATWMANAAQDLTGKFIGIWLPISAFAAVGYEHCIANMFLIPMAISQGADISAKQFVVDNLIPATLGNWIGGAVCVATTYAMVYGRTPVLLANWFHAKFEPMLAGGKKSK